MQIKHTLYIISDIVKQYGAQLTIIYLNLINYINVNYILW